MTILLLSYGNINSLTTMIIEENNELTNEKTHNDRLKKKHMVILINSHFSHYVLILLFNYVINIHHSEHVNFLPLIETRSKETVLNGRE
jgi:hypothetical protein